MEKEHTLPDCTPTLEVEPVAPPAKPAWHAPTLTHMDIKRTMATSGIGEDGLHVTVTP